MAKATSTRPPGDDASRIRTRRERLTIDFRRHGPALHAIAHSRRMTTAALARSVLGEWLAAQDVGGSPVGAMDMEPDVPVRLQKDAPFAKVTLRMPADRATRLAREAHAADLSQGMYVAQLLDAQSDDPMGASPRQLVSAVVRSNATLAALNSDLKALGRVLETVSCPEWAGLDVIVAGVVKEVGQHLDSAAPQIAALPASWRRTTGRTD